MGCQVVSTSSSNCRLINWDNSSIRVSNKSSIRSIASTVTGTIARTIDSWGNASIHSTKHTLGSKRVSTGSSNGWLIKRDNSSVGVSNKLGVQVEWSSISVADSSIRTRDNKGSSSSIS